MSRPLVLIAAAVFLLVGVLPVLLMLPRIGAEDLARLSDPRTLGLLARTAGLGSAVFAAALLTTAAVLSILSAAVTTDVRERRGWFVLAFGVTYLAIDEVVLIHERLPMVFRLDGDFATHAWLIPAIPIVAVALVVMAMFLRHLPRSMRPFLLLALATFAAGAIVIEGLTGLVGDDLGGGALWDKVVFPATIALEESLEFIGVIVLVVGIVAHLDRWGLFDVRRDRRRSTAREAQERTRLAPLR